LKEARFIKKCEDLQAYIKALEKDGFSGRSVDEVRHELKEQLSPAGDG
jgi:hypothetical protein